MARDIFYILINDTNMTTLRKYDVNAGKFDAGSIFNIISGFCSHKWKTKFYKY